MAYKTSISAKRALQKSDHNALLTIASSDASVIINSFEDIGPYESYIQKFITTQKERKENLDSLLTQLDQLINRINIGMLTNKGRPEKKADFRFITLLCEKREGHPSILENILMSISQDSNPESKNTENVENFLNKMYKISKLRTRNALQDIQNDLYKNENANKNRSDLINIIKNYGCNLSKEVVLKKTTSESFSPNNISDNELLSILDANLNPSDLSSVSKTTRDLLSKKLDSIHSITFDYSKSLADLVFDKLAGVDTHDTLKKDMMKKISDLKNNISISILADKKTIELSDVKVLAGTQKSHTIYAKLESDYKKQYLVALDAHIDNTNDHNTPAGWNCLKEILQNTPSAEDVKIAIDYLRSKKNVNEILGGLDASDKKNKSLITSLIQDKTYLEKNLYDVLDNESRSKLGIKSSFKSFIHFFNGRLTQNKEVKPLTSETNEKIDQAQDTKNIYQNIQPIIGKLSKDTIDDSDINTFIKDVMKNPETVRVASHVFDKLMSYDGNPIDIKESGSKLLKKYLRLINADNQNIQKIHKALSNKLKNQINNPEPQIDLLSKCKESIKVISDGISAYKVQCDSTPQTSTLSELNLDGLGNEAKTEEARGQIKKIEEIDDEMNKKMRSIIGMAANKLPGDISPQESADITDIQNKSIDPTIEFCNTVISKLQNTELKEQINKIFREVKELRQQKRRLQRSPELRSGLTQISTSKSSKIILAHRADIFKNIEMLKHTINSKNKNIDLSNTATLIRKLSADSQEELLGILRKLAGYEPHDVSGSNKTLGEDIKDLGDTCNEFKILIDTLYDKLVPPYEDLLNISRSCSDKLTSDWGNIYKNTVNHLAQNHGNSENNATNTRTSSININIASRLSEADSKCPNNNKSPGPSKNEDPNTPRTGP